MTTMPLGKKIALVAAALLVSLAAASAFRRDIPPISDSGTAATAQTRQFIEPVTRRLTADSAVRPPRAHTPFRLAPQPDPAFSPPLAATGAGTRELAGLPLSYQRTLSPVGALMRPLEGAVAGDTSREDIEDAPELFPATGPSAAQAGPRTHRIVDGDTLTKLAAEYLGSSDRYLEIYAINRDILNSPDLLPIGKTLKIPATDSHPEPAKLAPIPPGALRRAAD
jgi:nucleoid-associated protein YgaU